MGPGKGTTLSVEKPRSTPPPLPATPPIPITPGMFPQVCGPSGCHLTEAGDYTFNLARNAYSPSFLLREPRKTFRFTVATTF